MLPGKSRQHHAPFLSAPHNIGADAVGITIIFPALDAPQKVYHLTQRLNIFIDHRIHAPLLQGLKGLLVLKILR